MNRRSGTGVDPVVLTEPQIVGLAVVAWVGAELAVAVPVIIGVALLSGSLLVRSRWALLASVALLTSALAHRADDAYTVVEAEHYDGMATLVTDPESFPPVAASALVKLPDGRRLQLRANGEAAFDLELLHSGDRLAVQGSMRPLVDAPWLKTRHVVGLLGAKSVEFVEGPRWPRSVVERARSAVVAGSAVGSWDWADQALYLGLVVGDDRSQTMSQTARFKLAGLTHLLAVSGQNVAFVLGVARPLIGRFGYRGRWLVSAVVLFGFALATRLEPSVVRATSTAGLATISGMAGHRQSGLRLLSIATVSLIMVDPFLVDSVGFQLSIFASGGILVFGPPLRNWLADRLVPSFLAEPLSVTLAAQLAVLPLLLAYFGPVSTVAIPANLAAGWAAGGVMTWGLTVGVLAGVVGGWAGAVLQQPAHLLLWWLDRTASWASTAPFPVMSGVILWVVLIMVIGGWLVRVQPLPLAIGIVLFVVIAGFPTLGSRPKVGDGWAIWPGTNGHPTLVVLRADAREKALVEIVQNGGAGSDLAVSERGRGRPGEVAAALVDILDIDEVLAPSDHQIVGGQRVTTTRTVDTGAVVVAIRPGPQGLIVGSD